MNKIASTRTHAKTPNANPGQRITHRPRTRARWRVCPLTLLALAVLMLGSPLAPAQTEWDAATGDWFVDDNWTADTPDADTDALIDNDGTAGISAAGAEADALDVANGTLAIDAGGTLNNRLGHIGGLAGGTGTVTVSGADSEWVNDGGNTNDLVVGDPGNGTLEIINGARVGSTNGAVASGTVTVSGQDSLWENELDISIGRFGENGSLIIEAGGMVDNGRTGRIAFGSDSQGTVTITGAGSGWSNEELRLGEDGDGSLMIENGGSTSSTNSGLALDPDSTATAVVTGDDSLWVTEDEVIVGEEGVAEMTFSGGGSATIGNMFVGLNDGAQGTLAVTGAGSTLDLDSFIVVGGVQGGTGSLTINDGGVVVASTEADIGLDGVGTVTVSNPGSELNVNGAIFIGDGGTGTLSLTDGGRVVAADSISLSGAQADSTIAVGDGQAPGELDVDTVEFGASNAGLAFDHTGTGHVFSPALSGDGMISVLAGTTVLTADSAGFTGDTDVASDVLRVDGILGGTLDVQDAGTLGGTGTVGPTGLDGTVAPGESIGTLSVDGDLEFGAGATYRVELGAPGNNDLIAVDGDVILDGGLELVDAGGLDAGVYTILTATGNLTDNGLAITSQPPGLDPVIVAGSGAVTLEVSQAPAVSLDVAELDLGTVPAGDVASGEITVTNTGQTNLEISELAGLESPFTVTGGDCAPAPTSVPPASGCAIEVTLDAAAPVAGSVQDELDIITNAPSSPDTVPVVGEIQGQPVTPVPALGTSGLILLAGLMALIAGRSMARRSGNGRP